MLRPVPPLPFKKGDPRRALDSLTARQLDEIVLRVKQRLQERAFLLPPDRIVQRALAHMAYDCANAPTDPNEYEGWENKRIDEGIEAQLEDDLRSVARGELPFDGAEADPRCHFIAEFAKIDPAVALICATRFNGLPEAPRQAFVTLFVHDGTAEECIDAGYARDAEELQDLLAWALAALEPPDPDLSGYGEPQSEGRE